MKIVVGRILEKEIVCETEEDSFKLPKELFPKHVMVGDIADYEDGKIILWDEERQIEEEQLTMLFKTMC